MSFSLIICHPHMILIIRYDSHLPFINTQFLFIFDKIKHFDYLIKINIPAPRGLFRSKYGLDNLAYIVSIMDSKHFGLCRIHFPLYITSQEYSFVILMPYLIFMICNYLQAKSKWMAVGEKVKVNYLTLFVTFHY